MHMLVASNIFYRKNLFSQDVRCHLTCTLSTNKLFCKCSVQQITSSEKCYDTHCKSYNLNIIFKLILNLFVSKHALEDKHLII